MSHIIENDKKTTFKRYLTSTGTDDEDIQRMVELKIAQRTSGKIAQTGSLEQCRHQPVQTGK